ncbi:MAG: hypothetical protein BWZ01_01017 [Deltaproteobacteria bacterium ADurb.BinA179]|nr:MAG: hypothetical protein BWZ01_01017 [Deltaproteobacteria bacterium ADurb.BinA179]
MAICSEESTSPPGVWTITSMGMSSGVNLIARRTSSESLMSMNFMSGIPKSLMVSCRWIRVMTRDLRDFSMALMSLIRLTWIIFCWITGIRTAAMSSSHSMFHRSFMRAFLPAPSVLSAGQTRGVFSASLPYDRHVLRRLRRPWPPVDDARRTICR